MLEGPRKDGPETEFRFCTNMASPSVICIRGNGGWDGRRSYLRGTNNVACLCLPLLVSRAPTDCPINRGRPPQVRSGRVGGGRAFASLHAGDGAVAVMVKRKGG